MSHITHIQQWHSISIQVSSSLDHYTTGMVQQALYSQNQGNSWVSIPWSMGWSTPVGCGTCLISHSSNGGLEYPYLHRHPCITTSLTSIVVQALGSNIQVNSWVCLGCSWRSWCGLRGDPHLSDAEKAAYNTYKQLASISIYLPSSLYHYTTDEVSGSSSWLQCSG